MHQLTRETVVDATNPDPGRSTQKTICPLTGHIFDLAISPDARRIAFCTARQRFPLAPPNLIGSPPSSPGLVELYLIDREAEALSRVTHGLGGVDEPSRQPGERQNPPRAAVQAVGAPARRASAPAA